MDLSSRFMVLISALCLLLFVLTMYVEHEEVVDFTINWQPSDINEDGSTLTHLEIDKYLLSWRLVGHDLIEQVEVSGGETEYKLKEIVVGTYVFTIIAKTIYGTESRPTYLKVTIGSEVSII